jgi:hypothetical protein
MQAQQLAGIVRAIVSKAQQLKDKHTREFDAPANYACVFAQDRAEYRELCAAAEAMGTVILSTPTGAVFKITPLTTSAGKLDLLKIRIPDKTRPETGDADFTVRDYAEFKKSFLNQKGFSLIQKENMEMLELIDPAFNVRAYFSYPTLAETLKKPA